MKQKIHKCVVNYIKRHPHAKVPMLLVYTVFLTLYYSVKKLYDSRTKLAVLAWSVLIFLGSASFAYEDIPYRNQSEIRPVGPAWNETAPIDDAQVTEGYDNKEFEEVREEEKFEADDILKNDIPGSKQETKAELSRDDWNLVLINKQHAIPEEYTFTLGTIYGSMRCDERIIPELLEMLKAAKEDDIQLVICSPYRDLNRQKVLFNRKITLYMKKGMSYLESYKTTAQAVTVPGASEHQIGLALDIVCDHYASLNEGFGETDAGKWLAKNSYKYGFILRYPKGKEYITGISYEPWHFRYVGKQAATEITKQEITLEEFVESLPYE